jgi:curved DNA-binding protein CbpA
VRKAYKRAALRFHPDRTRSLSVAERARGEEVWKALGSKMEAFERTVA